MNLSKALVGILYDFITAKLHAYGVDYESLSLILSYLLNRQHRVKLDSVFRSRLETIIRVAQGSILGRLLFNMSLNGLLLISLRSIVCNLADDSTLYCCGETTENIIENLQSDLKVVLEWFGYRQTMAYLGKFQFLCFSVNASF